MKNKLVVFTENGAKIFINPKDFNSIAEDKITTFKNPDLSEVINLNPHKWAVKNGKIVPADSSLVKEREAKAHLVVMPTIKYKTSLKKRLFVITLIIAALGSIFLASKLEVKTEPNKVIIEYK